eukprot:1954464-Amphidinium_carterae.1
MGQIACGGLGGSKSSHVPILGGKAKVHATVQDIRMHTGASTLSQYMLGCNLKSLACVELQRELRDSKNHWQQTKTAPIPNPFLLCFTAFVKG